MMPPCFSKCTKKQELTVKGDKLDQRLVLRSGDQSEAELTPGLLTDDDMWPECKEAAPRLGLSPRCLGSWKQKCLVFTIAASVTTGRVRSAWEKRDDLCQESFCTIRIPWTEFRIRYRLNLRENSFRIKLLNLFPDAQQADLPTDSEGGRACAPWSEDDISG